MTALARCHICASVIPDTADDRRHHLGLHRHDEKRYDALRRELAAAKTEIQTLRRDLTQLANTPAQTTDGGFVINDIPADELDDDTDPDDELEPDQDEGSEDDTDLDTEPDTNLADLHDIINPAIDRDDTPTERPDPRTFGFGPAHTPRIG